MKISTAGRITSLLAGAGVFVVLYFTGLLEVAFALAAGVLGWLAVILLFSKIQGDKAVVVDGTTRADIEDTIKAGRKLTMGMRQAVQRLSQVEIRQEVEDLCRIAESMFELLKKDPNDIRVVKQFITYYLEPTHKIIVKYAELATTRPMPADAIATLERTEKSLKNIRATFLQQKEKMLANDVMDLDTEIKVFETLSGNMKSTSGQSDKNTSTQTRNGL